MTRAVTVAFLVFCLLVPAASAQGPIYTIPQTVQEIPANNVTCTGASQIFPVSNLGQTQHYASFSAPVAPTRLQMQIQGVDESANAYLISDTLELALPAAGFGTVAGSGYYPKVQIQVTCLPIGLHYTVSYSGTSATSNINTGTYLLAQMDKINFNGVAGNVNQSDFFQTPYGNSAGTLFFQYHVASVGGGTIEVVCSTSGTNATQVFISALANNLLLQRFVIPPNVCPTAFVNYVSGGAAGSVTTEYVFAQPGTAASSSAVLGAVTANQGAPNTEPNAWPVSTEGSITAPELSAAVVTFSGTGDNTIVAGVALKTIKLYDCMLTSSAATNLTFYDGTAGTALTGAYTLFAGGSLTTPTINGRPWATTTVALNLVINQSGTAQISGRCHYVQN